MTNNSYILHKGQYWFDPNKNDAIKQFKRSITEDHSKLIINGFKDSLNYHYQKIALKIKESDSIISKQIN